jgi:hypothetical protein
MYKGSQKDVLINALRKAGSKLNEYESWGNEGGDQIHSCMTVLRLKNQGR